MSSLISQKMPSCQSEGSGEVPITIICWRQSIDAKGSQLPREVTPTLRGVCCDLYSNLSLELIKVTIPSSCTAVCLIFAVETQFVATIPSETTALLTGRGEIKVWS